MIELTIPVANIESTSNRPYGGDGDIPLLAEDIKRNGLIHSITVRAVDSARPELAKKFRIVAGRRRLAAVKLLGWKVIKANALELAELDKAEGITGSENINRLAMHPLDEAVIFRQLVENGEPLENLAKRYDRTKAAIWQRVQLLDLNENVKSLFREGKLSLHAAAMLKSLDAEQQNTFYTHFWKSPNARTYEESGIPDWEVQRFIEGICQDKLYKCVAGPECRSCQKRTYYSDKELFPELDGADDTCLDHECYMGKWNKLLAHRIKSVKGEHKDHAGAVIIAADGDRLKKILGKSVTLDGAAYEVRKISLENRPAEEAGQNTRPCFEVDLTGGKLKITPKYWREAPKTAETKGKGESKFTPIVKLADLPKEEAEQTIAAMEKSCKQRWDAGDKIRNINNEVKEEVFDRLLEIKAKQPDNDKDIDRFLQEWLEEGVINRDMAKLFAGAGTVEALRKLSYPKLFAVLYTALVDDYELPNITGFDKEKQNDVADWAGISMDELKRMYQEEIRKLLPQPKSAQAKKKNLPSGEQLAAVRKCRVCGCTDDDCSRCIEKTGEPCHWVEPDLCSACAKEKKPQRGKK